MTDDAIAVWDIVRVDFPFADENSLRLRPALVIASAPATDDFAILWVLMITSAGQAQGRAGRWPGDVAISDLQLGGLSRPCVVRTGKVTSLDQRLAVRIGALALDDREGVASYLRDLLFAVRANG